jgi:hypothetical protein
MEQDLGIFLNEMRIEEQRGDTSALLLSLNQGRRASIYKKQNKKTWKADLQEHVGRASATWHQRVATYRDFGDFLLPEIPDDHVSTLPSSLALLTQLTKGCDEKARQAHLEAIAGLSYADVKKYVAERKGKEVHDCGPFEEIQVPAWKCLTCGKVHKKGPDSDA